jgi:hypothetical protein
VRVGGLVALGWFTGDCDSPAFAGEVLDLLGVGARELRDRGVQPGVRGRYLLVS